VAEAARRLRARSAVTAHPFWRVVIRGDIAARPVGAVIAVLLGTFMTSLFTRDFSISLPDIRGAYGLSVDEGAWLSTVTNAAQLLSAPVVPLLVMTFGARRLLMTSTLAFVLATMTTPLATGIPAIFALHALDGFLLGCFVPATLAIVFGSLPKRYWLVALGLYSVRLTVALHTGVSLSGWFVEVLGWQAIYWQATVFGLLFLLLTAVSFPDRPPDWSLFRRINKGEVTMYCVGLALLYAGLDQGNRLDWLASGTVLSLLGGGLSLVAAAIAWQFISPVPFAHPAVLLRRNILLPMIIVTMFGIMSAATSLLIPSFLATVAHLKPEQSGSALWWIDLIQLAALPLTIWSIRRGDIRLSLAIGLVLVMAGCWMGSALTSVWRDDDFAAMSMLIGAGNAAVLLSCIAITVANAAREDLISLVAYIQIPRIVGPELAAALLTTLIRQREAIHSVILGGALDRVRATALGLAPAGLGGIVRREAYVLAFADAYQLCFWVAALSLSLAIFLRRTPPHPLVQSASDSVRQR
jgi:DHA2 family multidrug resistance protein